MIHDFGDFVSALLKAGFSVGGENDEGVFALSSSFAAEVQAHTGRPETDPWEWRMRVLEERHDIANAKLFFHKSGYITKEWYPYFLAVRRGGAEFDDAYADGTVSQYDKRIYEAIRQNGALPFHAIKRLAGFGKGEQSKFEGSLIRLQMMMYMTMCGRQQKVSQMGLPYGWYSTVFCTTEQFWGGEVFEKAASIRREDAAEKIRERIFRLNPDADERKIAKFIWG